MEAGSVEEKASEFLNGQGTFLLSFVVGAVVIALYARKRISEFTRPPRGEEYDFTKMLTLDEIVGQSLFNKSYVFYVLFLEFLYVFICSSKPLVLLIASDPSNATFKGAAWPFGAALLVVGLLPSIPVIAQIEALLRGLAQRVASIPGEFYERVTKLSQSEIEKIVQKAPDYRPQLRDYWRIHNLLMFLGYSDDNATLVARNCIAVRLFSRWTIQGARVWSAEEFDKFRDIIAVLRPRTEQLSAEVDTLIAQTWKLAFLQDGLKNKGIGDISLLDIDALNAISDETNRVLASAADEESDNTIRAHQELDDIVKRWKDLAGECEIAAKRLAAMFAILARSDRETSNQIKTSGIVKPGLKAIGGRRPDLVLSALLELIDESYDERPWTNAGLVAGVAGFVGCMAPLSVHLYFTEIARWSLGIGDYASQHVTSIEITPLVQSSVVTALILAAMFGISSLVALFLRSLKVEDGTWVTFTNFKRMPLTNYFTIVGWCSLAAFMPLVISYIAYYYSSAEGIAEMMRQKPEVVVSDLFFRFVTGFTGVAYGIAVCIMADAISANREKNYLNALTLKLIAMVVLVQFLCLIVNPISLMSTRLFWHNLLSVVFFSATALSVFRLSFAANSSRDGGTDRTSSGDECIPPAISPASDTTSLSKVASI